MIFIFIGLVVFVAALVWMYWQDYKEQTEVRRRYRVQTIVAIVIAVLVLGALIFGLVRMAILREP